MRNFSEGNRIENKNAFYIQCPFFENYAFYKTLWKKNVESDRAHEHMAHAHCVLDN